MKRYILLALASVVIGSGMVAVTPEPADAWYCVARSAWGARWARGWGQSPYNARARAIALANCAARTPRGVTCYIVGCR
jgi:hypothetical protein